MFVYFSHSIYVLGTRVKNTMNQCDCSSCGEKYPCVQLFHCINFAEKHEIAGAVEKLCESCIVPHIRKHAQDVTDSKGNKPLVCTEHKILRLQYCRTCDLAFCSQCVSYHSKHEFQTLAEKDKELKKVIHEILTDLETVKEKPLRMKKEEISKTMEEKRQEIENLKQFVYTKMNQTMFKFNEILDRKLERVIAEENDLNNDVVGLGNMQAKCRTLLSMSTASLIEKLPEIRLEVETLNKAYQCSMAKEVKLNIVDVNSLEYLMKESEIKLMKAVEEERIKEEPSVFLAPSSSAGNALANKLAEPSVFLAPTTNDGMVLAHEVQKDPHGSLKIATLEIDFYGTMYQTSYSYTLPVSPNLIVEKVFPMRSDLLIKFDTGLLILFDISQKTFKVFEQPAIISLLWPCCNDSNTIEWSYWDEERKKIKFTNDDRCEIGCEQKPFIRMSCSEEGRLCFVDAKQEIINVDTDRMKKIYVESRIKPQKHQVKSIDCISIHHNYLFVWSISVKAVSYLQKDGFGRFQLVKKISWLDQPDSFEVNIKQTSGSVNSFTLVPSVKLEDSQEDKCDMFGVWP